MCYEFNTYEVFHQKQLSLHEVCYCEHEKKIKIPTATLTSTSNSEQWNVWRHPSNEVRDELNKEENQEEEDDDNYDKRTTS